MAKPLNPTPVPPTLRAAAERTIEAPAELAYHLIADFRDHHPGILPAAFSGLRVEAGLNHHHAPGSPRPRAEAVTR
jgi:hypothetical protein